MIDSVAGALDSHVPLLVKVMRKEAVVTSDADAIMTWYECHVIEALDGSGLPILPFDSSAGVPIDLQSLDQSSILLRNLGGIVTVDGVTVKSPEEPLALQVGDSYMLFVRFDGLSTARDIKTRVATLNFGTAAAFSYEPRTGAVTSLATSPSHPFVKDILSRTGGNLTTIRTHIVALRRSKINSQTPNK